MFGKVALMAVLFIPVLKPLFGVMQQLHLFALIREEFARLLNGYVRHRDILDGLDEYIQPPQLGGQAGVLGALVLAEKVAQRQADGGMRA